MNIVSIPFKGAYYMCIKGSKRAYALQAANHAFDLGEGDLADVLRRVFLRPVVKESLRSAQVDQHNGLN